jgi:hypothetical protein
MTFKTLQDIEIFFQVAKKNFFLILLSQAITQLFITIVFITTRKNLSNKGFSNMKFMLLSNKFVFSTVGANLSGH